LIFSLFICGIMNWKHLHLGYFISPEGGAPRPSQVQKGHFLIELLTRGRVRAPYGDQWLGAGWIACHRPGEFTVSVSPEKEHYECFTFGIPCPANRLPHWPRIFRWEDAEDAVRFAREMLFAFHHTSLDPGVIGELVWSQLAFRSRQFRTHEERPSLPPRVAAVMTRIERDPAEDLPVAGLAESVGVSASLLHSEFKRAAGVTPHRYRIECRLSAARHRLVTTLDPVKAIAFDLGFQSVEHFCRTFKRHSGKTAAEFRKINRVYEPA